MEPTAKKETKREYKPSLKKQSLSWDAEALLTPYEKYTRHKDTAFLIQKAHSIKTIFLKKS